MPSAVGRRPQRDDVGGRERRAAVDTQRELRRRPLARRRRRESPQGLAGLGDRGGLQLGLEAGDLGVAGVECFRRAVLFGEGGSQLMTVLMMTPRRMNSRIVSTTSV